MGSELRKPINKLQAPNVTIEQLEQYKQATQASNTMLQDDGLNVQINRQEAKFVYEDGLMGEQVYIVRLHQKSLANAAASGMLSQHDSSNVSQSPKLFVAGKATSTQFYSYKKQLLNHQKEVINSIAATTGVTEVRRQFTNAINGFSILMTQEQAEEVAKLGTVASVQRSKIYELHTDAGPELIQADKIWTGQATSSVPYKGEGIIVGIVDTGVNTDHPSFADVGGDGYDHTNPLGSGKYVGDCTKADFASLCNDKLIGVRSYPVITDIYTSGELGAKRSATGEDYSGHGSHTASTAAGNVLKNVDLSIPQAGAIADGQVVKTGLFPQLSGVAPHANIISYQVCYPDNENEKYRGCPGEALIAGIEDAISDGVDVINFSIGGQDSHPWSDDVELAFLAAREAGISVAASAGNSGQAGEYDEYFGQIDHASPWLLNVAASTHGREVVIETKLTNPVGGSEAPKWTEIVGGAINQTSVTGVVVKAVDYGNEYCGKPFTAGVFDSITDADGNPTNVIVVCKRNDINDPNGIARTVKADNVKAAGGDGMIMYNYAANDGIVSTATYSIPSVHITKEEWDGSWDNDMAGYGLVDWLAKGTKHVLTIGKTRIERELNADNADWLAAFSSRGPSPSTPEALIPAVAAPGVNVYAAFSDEHPFTSAPASGDFAFLSGTSMASPHVAGAMALLRQAHPDWSATEIQSALAMTADNVVKYRRLNRADGDEGLASTYRAGTGRINVANAVQAGLIMDETADNFKAADPQNGGVVHKLNIPQLVNFNCKPTCQWLRTVKATKDGSWKVSHEDVINWSMDMHAQAAQNGVTIKVTPEEFTLAAGETQTLMIEASIMDTQDRVGDSVVELHSNLVLTETTGASPEAHWPVVFKYDMNNMPGRLQATVHRNEGNYVFKGIEIPATDTPFGRVFEPVKADVKTLVLPSDDDDVFPWEVDIDPSLPKEKRLDEATHSTMIDVPANAKRLIVESLGTKASPLDGTLQKGNLVVYVGKDYNGNGKPDLDEEILCYSNHMLYNNFCNINNPEPGSYWAVFYNVKKKTVKVEVVNETFEYATAVVTDTVASDVSVALPSTDGTAPVDVTLSWNRPDMVKGDIYYSSMDFGTSEVNAGNIGKVALKLVRGANDVSLDVPQTAAVKGDKIPFTFEVLANQSGADRHFTLSAQIPDGLRVREEDIMVSSQSVVDSIKLEGKTLTISGLQPDTSAVKPSYKVTTNINDAQCRTPDFGNKKPGGYVNLRDFNITPSFGGFTTVEYGADGKAIRGKDNMITYSRGVSIPVSTMFNGAYDSFHLYNNSDNVNALRKNILDIKGTGIVALDNELTFYGNWHLGFPYKSFPYESIGMLWRGSTFAPRNRDIMSVPLGGDSGISLASTTSGWGIVEYDKARSYEYTGVNDKRVNQWKERDDRFDFELIFNVNTRFGDNEHEMYMAYDNINFGTQDGRGAIGLQGFKGLLSGLGPIEGYLFESFAMDDLKDKLSSGLVICYDYVGPESSQFEVTAWSEVEASATGKTLEFKAQSSIEGMADISMSHAITVPSNISLGSLANKTIKENTSLEELRIYYADEQNSVNKISVSGKHITAVVNGHTSGSSVTITPEKDFHGEVEVTVTVSDVETPSDAASTRFMLTVESDGVEPPPPPESNNGGGALGGLSMLLALGALIRRRKTHK